MEYTKDTTIRGESRGSPDAIIEWAVAKGCNRPDFVADYVREVYYLAPRAGIRAEVVIAQSIAETSVDGVPWKSYWFTERGNVAGIGITGDPAQNNATPVMPDGANAGRLHLTHLSLYVFGVNVPAILGPYVELDYRWDAAVAAGYAGVADTLDDLSGRWAVSLTYGSLIAQRLNLMASSGLLPTRKHKRGKKWQ